ncbi:hypothetical protein SO802_011147 [Lithocarpus litseifolius]|uniref:Uncharacterized protein n=1 Tax=Lithocarpus litseifolius TaxID=425828 RepID=A0AAW2DG63_9ROSI
MDLCHTKNPMQKLDKQKTELKAAITEQNHSLIFLLCFAFWHAIFCMVFQAVIFSVLSSCSSDFSYSGRWCLFIFSVSAATFNLIALLRTGIKYNKTKVVQDEYIYQGNKVQKKLVDFENGLESNKEDAVSNELEGKFRDFPRECRRYTYLFVYMIFSVAFSVIVIVGCWNTLRDKAHKCLQMTKKADTVGKDIPECYQMAFAAKTSTSCIFQDGGSSRILLDVSLAYLSSLSWLAAAKTSTSCIFQDGGSRRILLDVSLAYLSKSLLSLRMTTLILTFSMGLLSRAFIKYRSQCVGA